MREIRLDRQKLRIGGDVPWACMAAQHRRKRHIDIATDDPGNLDGMWQPGERLFDLALYQASSSDMALLLSYARHHGQHWAFGGNLKFVRQSIPDTIPGEHVTSFGAGLDAGLVYMPSDAITIGVMARDLTTTYLSWSNGSREIVAPTLHNIFIEKVGGTPMPALERVGDA